MVTGAAIGTGRAISLALAGRGARVIAADVDDDAGRETERRGGGAVQFVHLDVVDGGALAALINGSAPTILINNAGGGAHVPWRWLAATPDQWTFTLEVNLLAPMRATQLTLPVMRAAGGGAVVNIASSAAYGREAHPWPEYATAKAGLVRFTTSLRGFDERVRVNCLVPNWIATERLTERSMDPPPIPLSHVTEQTLRLVSEDSLSGRVIVLDRGRAPELLD